MKYATSNLPCDRRFLQLVILAGLVCLTATEAWAESPPSPDAGKKKLIAWGGIDWYLPSKVQGNIREIEKLPFDGTVLQGFRANKDGEEVMFDWLCFGKEKFEREQLKTTIAVLKAIDFQKFTDNFLRFNVTPGDVDWFDDFDAIFHNARLWAEVANETGMKGWAFDVEDYKGTVFDYRKQKYRDTKTLAEYEAQARLRGRQFMAAVEEGYPDIVLLLMLAHSYVNRTENARERLAEHEYGLLPAFLNGMIEAAGPRVTLIDGHEQGYGHMTPEDFFRGYHDSRQRALDLVPPDLHAPYRDKMDVGMAVYANYTLALTEYPGHWETHYLTANERMRLFEQNVYYAMTVSDKYVWLYSERMGWWEKGYPVPTPDGSLEAIRSAREKIRRGEPLDIDLSRRVKTARATVKEANPYPGRGLIVPRISTAPADISDMLEGPVWRDVPKSHPFTPDLGARATTLSKAVYDDEHLYVFFRCAEPDAGKIKSVGNKKDDDAIIQGDCVEVFLRVAEKMPFHFIVNPQNVQWDGKSDIAEWNAQWRSAARIGSNRWTAVLAIPWEAVGGPLSTRVCLFRRRAATNELTAVVQDYTLEK